MDVLAPTVAGVECGHRITTKLVPSCQMLRVFVIAGSDHSRADTPSCPVGHFDTAILIGGSGLGTHHDAPQTEVVNGNGEGTVLELKSIVSLKGKWQTHPRKHPINYQGNLTSPLPS